MFCIPRYKDHHKGEAQGREPENLGLLCSYTFSNQCHFVCIAHIHKSQFALELNNLYNVQNPPSFPPDWGQGHSSWTLCSAATGATGSCCSRKRSDQLLHHLLVTSRTVCDCLLGVLNKDTKDNDCLCAIILKALCLSVLLTWIKNTSDFMTIYPRETRYFQKGFILFFFAFHSMK